MIGAPRRPSTAGGTSRPARAPGRWARYRLAVSPRERTTLVVLATLLVGAVVLRLMVGGGGLALPGWDESLIWRLRSMRCAVGLTVGGALGVAGVLLQALLRNPLASPDLLGLASGAGLGVMLSFGAGAVVGQIGVALFGITVPAIVGSMLALTVVYLLSQHRGFVDPVPLILVGVIVSIICSAGTLLVQHLLPDRGLTAARWMLGSIRDDIPMWQVAGVALGSLIAIVWSALLGPAMDASSLSDDEALAIGLRLGPLRLVLFLLAGLLTAGSVVLAGPVGFVGLVCPHLVRLLGGPRHRALVLGSALAGGGLVVLADSLVKAIELPTGRLPIGVLTTLLGGPLFIALLRREMVRVGD